MNVPFSDISLFLHFLQDKNKKNARILTFPDKIRTRKMQKSCETLETTSAGTKIGPMKFLSMFEICMHRLAQTVNPDAKKKAIFLVKLHVW